MRIIVAILLATLTGTASAQESGANSLNVEKTIDRGLGFLAKDAVAWRVGLRG